MEEDQELGVSISPIAFIVVQQSGVKLLPIEHSSSLDKLLDLVPDLIDKRNEMIDSQMKKMKKSSTNSSNNTNTNEMQNSNNQPKTPTENTTNININTEPKRYDIEYDETLDM